MRLLYPCTCLCHATKLESCDNSISSNPESGGDAACPTNSRYVSTKLPMVPWLILSREPGSGSLVRGLEPVQKHGELHFCHACATSVFQGGHFWRCIDILTSTFYVVSFARDAIRKGDNAHIHPIRSELSSGQHVLEQLGKLPYSNIDT
jgi:hypothetical protein